jgi:hypothetical protein
MTNDQARKVVATHGTCHALDDTHPTLNQDKAPESPVKTDPPGCCDTSEPSHEARGMWQGESPP